MQKWIRDRRFLFNYRLIHCILFRHRVDANELSISTSRQKPELYNNITI